MPKDTFFNLPKDKRTLICNVAIAEFAEYSFDQASINRIVAESGIAKGSYYQYFEDKQDLFSYILQLVAEEKASYLAPIMQNPGNHDFFTLLREMYVSGIRLAAEHPEYEAIGRKLLENKDAPVYRETMAGYLPSAYEFFEALLEGAVARGEVRADLDVKMLAYMTASMNALVVEYYIGHVAPQYGQEMLGTIDQFVDFLRNGMGTRNPVSFQ